MIKVFGFIFLLAFCFLDLQRASAQSCEQKEADRLQQASIYLVESAIVSPLKKPQCETCENLNPSKVEEGCDFIRNQSWKFSFPFGRIMDWRDLQNEQGGPAAFYKKFGLIPSPKSNNGLPMGVTLGPNGRDLYFNCFLCHGGTVNGEPFEGASNSKIKVDELLRSLKTRSVYMDTYLMTMGSLGVEGHPEANRANDHTKLALELRKGSSKGNFNLKGILTFLQESGKAFKDMPVTPVYAPPWWNSAPGLRKSSFFSGQLNLSAGHLGIMTMMSFLSKKEIAALNPSFEKALACVQSTPIPRKVFPTDPELVKQGAQIFNGGLNNKGDCNCNKCHGKTEMDKPWDYPEKQVPLNFVKTDPEMARSFNSDYRKRIAAFMKDVDPCSQFEDVEKEYIVAPPLIALFTKSGLLHNRSVPTLKDLLCTPQDERPMKWKIKGEPDVFDADSVDRSPTDTAGVYNTEGFGAKNIGHDFCTTELKNDSRSCKALIEYMKTLGP